MKIFSNGLPRKWAAEDSSKVDRTIHLASTTCYRQQKGLQRAKLCNPIESNYILFYATLFHSCEQLNSPSALLTQSERIVIYEE